MSEGVLETNYKHLIAIKQMALEKFCDIERLGQTYPDTETEVPEAARRSRHNESSLTGPGSTLTAINNYFELL
ncbi:unnamed protein product [Dicrocoelium dendriticum]|nr:unnamed protein product [Dicrocoelium dendriticum]